MSGSALIVHRSEELQELIARLLAPLDLHVGEVAMRSHPRTLGDTPLDLVVVDFGEDSVEQVELLRDLRKRQPACAVVAVADARGATEAVEALADCVDDYVLAPPEPGDFRARCRRVLQTRGLHRRLELLQQELSRRYGAHRIVCRSSAMEQVYARVLQLAPTKTTVLITGDSGAGKELIARSLHYNSGRRDQPFVAMNCGSVTETLIESELFGHQRGAFTGAVETVAGKFELANGGTLFLDEVGSMPLAVQSRFLRVLEQGEFMRVGGTKTLKVDVRVVAATNTDLEQQVKDKEFRRDLLYRLKVATIEVPPLRRRVDDIPVLARNFVKQLCEENGVAVKELSPEAVNTLCRHDWPGNVRELKNLLESLVVTVSERVIEPEHLPDFVRRLGEVPGAKLADSPASPFRVGMTLAQAEEEMIRVTLTALGGNRSRAARTLGIGLRTLQRKIKELRIDVPVGTEAGARS
jgi:DNA-binding NtrC family response regulator